MTKVESQFEEFRTKVEQVIIQKETQIAKELTEEIEDFIRSNYFKTQEEGLRQKLFVEYLNDNFDQITWNNPTNAIQLINQANSNIKNGGSISQLETICSEIYNLIDRTVDQPDIPV